MITEMGLIVCETKLCSLCTPAPLPKKRPNKLLYMALYYMAQKFSHVQWKLMILINNIKSLECAGKTALIYPTFNITISYKY